MFVHQTLGASCIVVNTASSTFHRLRVSSWDHHLDVTVQIVFVLNFSSLVSTERGTVYQLHRMMTHMLDIINYTARYFIRILLNHGFQGPDLRLYLY